jgi:ribosomal protein S18 acetylase RimI-like enzyme
LKKGDEAHLARIFSECFGPVTKRRLQYWYRLYESRPEHFFIGEVDGKPVSNVEVVFKQLHLGEDVYIKTGGISGVCTDSDYRKKGIITHLMKLSLNYAENNRGVSNSSLYTGLDIPAHRIYSRLGFVDVETERTYIKYLDYPFIFARWIRMLNRQLKDSKIAAKKLQGWQKSVVIELKKVETISFKFRKGRFQKLKKPPKKPDIILSTDILTFTQMIGEGLFNWDESVKAKKITLKRGEPADFEMLERIIRWKWGY